jgi:hypothetical protein
VFSLQIIKDNNNNEGSINLSIIISFYHWWPWPYSSSHFGPKLMAKRKFYLSTSDFNLLLYLKLGEHQTCFASEYERDILMNKSRLTRQKRKALLSFIKGNNFKKNQAKVYFMSGQCTSFHRLLTLSFVKTILLG